MATPEPLHQLNVVQQHDPNELQRVLHRVDVLSGNEYVSIDEDIGSQRNRCICWRWNMLRGSTSNSWTLTVPAPTAMVAVAPRANGLWRERYNG